MKIGDIIKNPNYNVKTKETTYEEVVVTQEMIDREKEALEVSERQPLLDRLVEIDEALNPIRLVEEIIDNDIPQYKLDLIAEKKEIRAKLK